MNIFKLKNGALHSFLYIVYILYNTNAKQKLFTKKEKEKGLKQLRKVVEEIRNSNLSIESKIKPTKFKSLISVSII